MHVTIQEGQHNWALNLEKTLGYHLLTGFVVTNREDNIKLKVTRKLVFLLPRNLTVLYVCVYVCVYVGV